MVQVEGEAQGTEGNLESFISELNDGPRHANVVKLEKEEAKAKDAERVFEVR